MTSPTGTPTPSPRAILPPSSRSTNEKEQGITVDYDELVKSWAETAQ